MIVLLNNSDFFNITNEIKDLQKNIYSFYIKDISLCKRIESFICVRIIAIDKKISS